MADCKEIEQDGIQGVLHLPLGMANQSGVVLTHGAGANCESALLVNMAEQLASQGFHVLRCNLAFRQRRRTGPPHPSKAADDRHSLLEAARYLRTYASRQLILGGHSYGGRQASILASEDRTAADRLLLFSYPLHPPEKPAQLRTAHFPKLQVAATFVHGAADPFGTPEEMRTALELIPAPTKLTILAKAGHELLKGKFDLMQTAGPL